MSVQKYFGKRLGNSLRYSWNRVIGIPARLLMRIMSRGEPVQEYDGIRLIVTDFWLVPSAERFFERTREALIRMAAGAPLAYGDFRRDVQQVLLWGQTKAVPYNRFQLAAVVPPKIALEADTACYAAWLLHTSGLFYGQGEAQARLEEFLRSLELDERTRVLDYLSGVTERGPP